MVAGPPRDASRPTAHLVAPGLWIFLRSLPKPIPAFREGNGRVARMLATLMGLQSDLPPLGFGKMGGRSRKEYFAAVQAGMGGDYRPMEKIFSAVIRRTLRRQA